MIRTTRPKSGELTCEIGSGRQACARTYSEQKTHFLFSFFLFDGRVKVEDGEEGKVREGVGCGKALMFRSSGC